MIVKIKECWGWKKAWVLSVIFTSLVLLFLYQNCSHQDMKLSQASFSGESIDARSNVGLQAPVKTKKIDRYIFLVDMSFSMVSGPCPQDVDSNVIFDRSESRRPVNQWDPNKCLPGVSISDYQQSAAFDCYVDPQKGADDFHLPYRLPNLLTSRSVIGVARICGQSFTINPTTIQNATIVGSDYQAHRLSVVTKWLAQLRSNLSEERKKVAQVLIVPYTSGVAKNRLQAQIQANFDFGTFGFRHLNDRALDNLLVDLKRVHDQTFLKAKDQEDFHRWKNRAMGASSPTEVFDRLYEVVLGDMSDLSRGVIRDENGHVIDEDNSHRKGLLRRARYNMFFLSDGMLTPIKEQVDVAMKIHHKCGGCDSGGTCDSVCGEIRSELIKSLGDPDLNSKMMLILKMGKIQALTDYFGAGRMFNHFIQVNHDYYERVYGHVDSLFEILRGEFERYKYPYKYWKLNGDELPFDLAVNQIEYRNFSLTSLIILNPNVRMNENGSLKYDSDADGLFDDDERTAGTDPLNPRSNGVCLDSLAVHSAYQEKCASFTRVPDCDPRLDRDMDSLNDCEEKLLGTNHRDFDTDNDMIPDYFEWTYEFNPLLDEMNHDTNGDGVTNLKAFLAGLGPSHSFTNIDENALVRFQINEGVTNQRYNDMWITAFTIDLENIPFGFQIENGEIPSQYKCLLYNSRVQTGDPCDHNPIELDEFLFHTVTRPDTNKGVALLRLRDKDNEKNIVWKIMKFDFSRNSEANVFQLSDFNDLDVFDEVND